MDDSGSQGQVQCKKENMKKTLKQNAQTLKYCTAGNYRQRKISSKVIVRQFVRNLFSSNVGLSFAYRLSSHS